MTIQKVFKLSAIEIRPHNHFRYIQLQSIAIFVVSVSEWRLVAGTDDSFANRQC